MNWPAIVRVQIGRYVDFQGVLLGGLATFLGFCAFVAGWIKNTHEGPGVVTIPILGFLGGGILIFGCLRNRIVVETQFHSFSWVSEPMTYRRTLSICREAAELCRSRGVSVTSHVEHGDS